MPRIAHKHPLAIRWFHWLNFPILAVMVWSGTLILWANDVYATQLWQGGYRVLHRGADDPNPPKWLKVPDRIVVRPEVRVVYAGDDYTPPEGAVELQTGFRLAQGMAWHFALAWLFALNGLGYTLFLVVSGQWRHLAPQKNSLKEAVLVAVKELAFWRRIEAAPAGQKYNAAQRIAYSAVWAIGALMLVTGLAISKPAQLAWLSAPFGGYQGARLWHFVLTCLLVAFFFVHVTQVLRAGWNNLRAMLTGWERLPDTGEVETIVAEPALLEEEVEIEDEREDTGADGEGA